VAAFGRIVTALATPFTAERALDLKGAQQLATHVVDGGCDGVVVAGTTGESPTVSHEELVRLCRAVVEAVGDRATVIANTGKNDTAETIELTREVAACGVDGLLAVTPYYNKPPQRGLVSHFESVAGATELPVLLYDIPSRTGRELAPQTLVRLSEVANIKGVKDATKDLDKAAWVAARTPESFATYAGNDIDLLPLLAIGAVGVVSVAGHFVADSLAEMITTFPTDPAAARAVHHRLLGLFEALFADANPIPLKAGLAQAGLPGGPVRAPLADADEAVAAAMRDALMHAGIPRVAAAR
jgi:4-hydroxy-tetrahydrodipicolinate synthase